MYFATSHKLIVGTVVALCFAQDAEAQTPNHAICDPYATTAVSLSNDNLANKCGLTGPEWNSDYRYHYDWCMQGRNSASANAWNDWRRNKINQCRAAAVPPTLFRMLPQLATPPKTVTQPEIARQPQLKMIPRAIVPPAPQIQPQPQAQPQPPAQPKFQVIPETAILPRPSLQPSQAVAVLCDQYAREAIAAHRLNMEAACGFAGPQWNASFSYHYDWCAQGRNSASASAWTKWRSDQLDKCRSAAATGKQPPFKMIPDAAIVPKPGAPTPPPAAKQPLFKVIPDIAIVPRPGLPTPQVPPTQPRAPTWAGDINSWANTALQRIGRDMDRLTEALKKARLRRYGERPKDLKAVLPKPESTRELIQEQAITQSVNQKIKELETAGPLKKPLAEGIYEPPRIVTLFYFPQAEALQPDMYVIIQGSGFGTEPGRAYLSYSSGSGELAEGKRQHNIEFEPLHGSWSDGWADTVVVVRVPSVLPGEKMGGTRDAVVSVVRSNGAMAQVAVLLEGGSFPIITSATTNRGTIGCCCPVGTEIWSQLPGSHDYVYWPRPTPYYSWTTPCGLDKKPWLEPGGTAVIHGKRFGKRTDGTIELSLGSEPIPGLPRVGLEVDSWTDTEIHLRVENVPISGYFALRPAWIDLQTSLGRAKLEPVAFGPEMDSKWVSGYRWLEKKVQKEAQRTDDDTAMIVVHVPKCDWALGSKEQTNQEGFDDFFAEPDAPYPEDVRITWVRFKHIDPTNPVSDWDVLGPEVLGLIDVIFDPASLVIFGLKTFFKAIFLANEGGYHAYPPSSPKNKTYGVRWASSCAIGDGKPIVYFSSFLIEGPPKAVAKY